MVLAGEITDFIKGRLNTGLFDWGTLWSGIIIFVLFAVMWPYLIIHQNKNNTEDK
jgi:hypothetical protein